MDGGDERLDPVRSFTLTCLRCDPDKWREFVSVEDNQVTFNSFFSSLDFTNMFIHQDADGELAVGLDFPKHVRSKVICVCKTGRDAVTKETARKSLLIQEVLGEDATSFIIAVSEEVTCPLLSNPESSSSWAAGVAEEALRFMEQQKNEALVMKAQIQGQTFLPPPDALRDHGRHGNAAEDSTLHDEDLHDDAEGRKWSDVKLLHACDWSIIEWAELVSEFLQQDSSQPVLDGLKPLPSEEFHFWENRLKNLTFIQQQLMSSRAQQVASIVQKAESVYWSTLRDIYRDVQEGLTEAEDVTLNLKPVQKKLEELEHLEYQQLGDNMAAVMQEVRLLWIRSEFYCKPCRMVVLLQEVCNLLIQRSRKFLRGEEVMRGLVSDPGPVLEDVTLVIWTLQTLKEAYSHCRTQLEQQKQDAASRSCWDFPPHLIFFHLDHFLLHLQSIQEVLRVSLQMSQLDQTVLSGVAGRMWTDVVQEVYQDFVGHVTRLTDCTCDPTDPEDQSLRLLLDQFQVQVLDLERRLVSVLSRAFEDCSASSSAAKLVQMFRFILDRPLILDQLRPHLVRLVERVLVELDQTELLFHSHRENPDTLSRFHPDRCSRLCWTRQLQLRAEDSLNHYTAARHLYLDSGASQLVLQRFQQVVDLVQDFRDGRASDWSSQLDSDCGFILEQPLIHHKQQGMLGVHCSLKLEGALRELRYVSRETDVELRPHAARLFTCRDDITQSYLSLSHMVSCYNQVLREVLQVECPLIQVQLQDLNQSLSELQRNTWSCDGVQQQVQQHRDRVMAFHSTVSEARANMDAMTRIIQAGRSFTCCSVQVTHCWGAELQRKATDESERRDRSCSGEPGLYGAEASSESWIRYLDHIDDRVQDGLFQLLLRSLHFLCDNMNPQSCSGVFVAVSLQLQETGSVFDPSVGGGLCDLLKSVISDVYAAAALPPRISVSRHGNYQVSLQQSPDLSSLEQEVMRRLQQVGEEAELVRAGLDRFSYLWRSDRTTVMQEFLTYSRQLGPEEGEAEETPPTLKDFHREVEALQSLSREVSHLDDVIVVHSWLQVELRPFRDSLLSIIQDWRLMYTEHLLHSARASLQQVTQRGDDDEESSSSSSFPLTETILLLEAAGVELPEDLSAQLQC